MYKSLETLMVPQGLTLPQLGWSYGIEKLLFMTMTRASADVIDADAKATI